MVTCLVGVSLAEASSRSFGSAIKHVCISIFLPFPSSRIGRSVLGRGVGSGSRSALSGGTPGGHTVVGHGILCPYTVCLSHRRGIPQAVRLRLLLGK